MSPATMAATRRAERRSDRGGDRPEDRRVDHRERLIVFVVMAVAFLAGVAVAAYVTARHTDGHFIYPLDDVYIHISLAKNLALHGTWGVVPGVYSSASSSPIWTLLLALLTRIAPSGATSYPLALDIVIGLGLLWCLTYAVPIHRTGSRLVGVLLGLVMVAATGVVPLAVSGMEALLFAGLFVAILLLLERAIERGLTGWERACWAGVLFLATVTRFETLFIGAGCVLALVVTPPAAGDPGAGWLSAWRKRWTDISTVVVAITVPVLVYAIVNRAYGEYTLPNSVMSKSTPPGGLIGQYQTLQGWRKLFGRAMVDPQLLLLAGAVAAVAVVAWRLRRRGLFAAAIAYLAVGVLHVAFDTVGVLNVYFARYDTYLVIAGIVLVARAAWCVPLDWRTVAGVALAGLLLVSAVPRVRLVGTIPAQGHEIYRQQLQTARFLERYYDGQAVAVNDLGETSLHHRGPLLDLTGLASFALLQAKHDGTYGQAVLDQQAKAMNVQVIAVYPSWFLSPDGNKADGFIPDSWVPLEQWCLVEPDIQEVGDRCVWFYAADQSKVATLRKNLDDFHAQLPPGIVWDIPIGQPLPTTQPLQPPPPV